MRLFNELCGMNINSMLNISIPKEKLIANIKTRFVQISAARELDYVEDIIYHAIFRDDKVFVAHRELHIIEVRLQEPKYVKIIAEALEQAIPYSKIIIFSSGAKYLLFESYASGEPLKELQFSDWVYEEELMIDFSIGMKRQLVNNINPDNLESWEDIPALLSGVFNASTFSGYLCMRHLMDVLKIRERQYDKEFVRPIIFQLFEHDQIEYFDDIPFITWSNADSLYCAMFPYRVSGIQDERLGIDKQFEPLTLADFSSHEDVLCLLEEIECLSLHQGCEPYIAYAYSYDDYDLDDDTEMCDDEDGYEEIDDYNE